MNYTWSRFITEDELKTVGIVICIAEDDKFLIIRRSNIDEREGQWTLPGGHIDDEDASIEAGALRELQEEAGLACSVGDLNYLARPKPAKYYFWTTKWKGDVTVDQPNPKTGEIEHDDWKWATIEDVKEIQNTEIPIYLLEKALEMSKNVK